MSQTLQDLIDEFNTTNQWGMIVVPQAAPTSDQLFADLEAALEQGTAPDLTVAPLYQAQQWDQQKVLVDLTPYINDPTWGYTPEEQADFYPVFWQHDIHQGKRLGVPALRFGQLLFYNATWGQELGFSVPPATPDMFRDQACAAAQANRLDNNPENDSSGGWIISTQYSAMLGWLAAYDGQIITPEENRNTESSPYQFNTAHTIQALTFLRQLYDDGCTWHSTQEYPDTDFAARRGLFATGSLSDIPYITEALKQAGSSDQWRVLPFPSPDGVPAFTVYGPSFNVLGSSPVQQLASWIFIKWLLESPNQARLVRVSGALPLRPSTLDALKAYAQGHLQWADAANALEFAQAEPQAPSWYIVRFALSDAGSQLFRSYFTIDQVPSLVKFLDQTAAELHLGAEKSGVFDTPNPTPTPSSTPTRTTQPAAAP